MTGYVIENLTNWKEDQKMFPKTSNTPKETGNNAGSIPTEKGENVMESTQYTDDELQIIRDLENMKLNPSKSNGAPDEIPAGSYLASITNASRSIHDEGQYDIVTMEIKVQAEPYSGRILNKVYHQKSRKAVGFFKREMKEIGYDVSSPNELESLCKSLVGTIIVADVFPSESGNQQIFLKNANTKRTVTPVDPDSLWG